MFTQKAKKRLLVIAVAIVGVAVFNPTMENNLFKAMSAEFQEENANGELMTRANLANDAALSRMAAYTKVRHYVEDHLTAPHEISFPPYTEAKPQMNQVDYNTYEITTWVKGTDKFGDQFERQFYAKFRYQEDASWEIIDFHFNY